MAATAFLFVFARPPYAGLQLQEMLDMTLTAAAFDQKVNVLLIDDGVYALKHGQQPQQLECKDIRAVFESFELFDVEHVYAEAESLEERGLSEKDLCLAVRLIPRARIGTLMRRQKVIVSV